MSVLTHLLPDSSNLRLENCQLDKIKTQINLIVSAISRVVNCPVCNQRLSVIGLANGGAAGERLLQQWGIKVSRNTLLNLVRSIPLPPIVTPHTLGVDDFCFRKCKTYGTALIDLERSRAIALLKDALAETLTEWLKAHPGVKVVSRDRSKTYPYSVTLGKQ
ncbi:hypothetical protein LC613_36485 [Nostoc sphaeroides CHAB 2801]|uniref:hypothetical protein n=1 Tax=Nostoc sphaeroides TaxID=446679 RepID=UPI001E48A30A|nr:hypothetical protein [Nostoc sphaeroides]MCC5633025.1 hypothetical protein [Nostoc sphaeroides CHAB 2801]